MSYNRYETSSYNRDDDRTPTGNKSSTIRRSWDDTDRSNTNNDNNMYFSRTTTYRDSDRDTTGTSRPFGTGSYTTGNTNTYSRDSDYNRGNTDTTRGYTTTGDRYTSGTSDRYTGERGTPSSYDRGYPMMTSDRYTTTGDRYTSGTSDRYTGERGMPTSYDRGYPMMTSDRYTTTGPRNTGYTGDMERFNVDRSNDRGYTGYTGESRGYTGETRGYTGETRGYIAGSDAFNRTDCVTCPDTYNSNRFTGQSAGRDYNTRGGYGYTATTDYNRGCTDRDTYGPRNYDRDMTTTTGRYTPEIRGGDNYTTGNRTSDRGFGGYPTTGYRSTF